ncbi:ubiquitin-associated protein 1 [Erpetoichthys calabaricus]|uniref:ubiquitin-associated protein 1 n=1 Tax=Erpetoichthys calabaricus TaxID=27687 RepID=UPI0022346D48|nr:ubiquitin-associated protein 1 [Erpetoichthys calabaricus]
MNIMDEVPFRIASGILKEPTEEPVLIPLPDFSISDFPSILREIQYDFTMERWVLQSFAENSQTSTSETSSILEAMPSAPSFLLMIFSKDANSNSKIKNNCTTTALRSRNQSLNATDLKCYHPRVRFMAKSSESDDGYSEDDECSSSDDWEDTILQPTDLVKSAYKRAFSNSRLLKKTDLKPKTSQYLSSLSSPDGSSMRRRNVIFSSQKVYHDNEKNTLSMMEEHTRSHHSCCQQKRPKRRLPSLHRIGENCSLGSLTPQPPSSPPSMHLKPRPCTAGHIPDVRNHKPKFASFSSYSCLPPPPSMCHSACPFISRSDTSADLLLALSKEEQDLLKPVLELGYPMSRAIRALQKIGRQSSAQILSYLMVCDRFCKQGYEESLVEEALEMFQYCEIKVDEFLHLVTEFTEMGFPLNAVKEVLLVHENHKEKALEELVSQIE